MQIENCKLSVQAALTERIGEGPFLRAAQLDEPPLTPALSPEYRGEGANAFPHRILTSLLFGNDSAYTVVRRESIYSW